MGSSVWWKYLVTILVIVWKVGEATSRTIYDEASMLNMHEQWIAHHGRSYESVAEKQKRFKIFKHNVEFIESFNRAGNRTYHLGINKFTDLTKEEFLASHTGYKMSTSPTSFTTSFNYENVGEADVPASMDWRQHGAVTPVKNQAQCGICWAFSSVAAIEGLNYIRTGQLVSLSEQEILDCDQGAYSCSGNDITHGFDFVIKNQGLMRDVEYPYRGEQGMCQATNGNVAVRISGYENVPQYNEEALRMAVAKQPVSVAVDSTTFQHYMGGILTGECGTNLNHAITAIGYGTSEDGAKFWIFKNSWGTTWGENGYIRMARDIDAQEGICGIAMHASYPTMD